MVDDSLSFDNPSKTLAEKITIEAPMMQRELGMDGHNEDMVTMYYWHLHFPYLVGKGYAGLKLEDYHYFSESSQFGGQIRQIKGGSIKAFQENLAQLVQLIKVHMMPLLKEVKQAEFYKEWFDKIVENDELIQKELEKSDPNRENLKKWRGERNEAINHIKDKWVNEVEGGRMWQMNRQQSEQGLDFALLPQLFFGINLDNPLPAYRTKYYGMQTEGKSLQKQLEDDIYTVDITKLAKEQVARHLFKFHTWLPTAIKETRTTYRVKISALKQFYAQLQMYINFMKPLLLEIERKSEGFESSSKYRDFELDNPEVINLFDYSYSYIKLLMIRDFFRTWNYDIKDLEMNKFGLYVRNTQGGTSGGAKTIKFGKHAGEQGYIMGEVKKDGKIKYEFLKTDKKDLTVAEFKELYEKWEKEPVYINKKDLWTTCCMVFEFKQSRRQEIIKSEQGPQPTPYMRNRIFYSGYSWNIFEIAAYRERLKVDNLKLLETFVDEIKVVRDEILYYINDLEDLSPRKSSESKEEKNKEKADWTFVAGPFRGIGELFSPLIPSFNIEKKNKDDDSMTLEQEKNHLIAKLRLAEEMWKCYTVFKKSNGLIQF